MRLQVEQVDWEIEQVKQDQDCRIQPSLTQSYLESDIESEPVRHWIRSAIQPNIQPNPTQPNQLNLESN